MVILSKDLFANDTLYNEIVLDLSTKHEISKPSLKKLTKTQVLFPTTIEDAIARISAIYVLSSLFFSEISILLDNLEIFLKKLLSSKTLLKTSQYLDEMFIPKLLFTIDDRIYKWLQSCTTAENVTKTNTELINFEHIILEIQMNRFHCNIPNNIMNLLLRRQKLRTNRPVHPIPNDQRPTPRRKTKEWCPSGNSRPLIIGMQHLWARVEMHQSSLMASNLASNSMRKECVTRIVPSMAPTRG